MTTRTAPWPRTLPEFSGVSYKTMNQKGPNYELACEEISKTNRNVIGFTVSKLIENGERKLICGELQFKLTLADYGGPEKIIIFDKDNEIRDFPISENQWKNLFPDHLKDTFVKALDLVIEDFTKDLPESIHGLDKDNALKKYFLMLQVVDIKTRIGKEGKISIK